MNWAKTLSQAGPSSRPTRKVITTVATDKNDKKTAGKDESRKQETSEQAKVEQEKVPTEPEETGESDPKAAASGSEVGAVRDGDTGLDGEDGEDGEDGYDDLVAVEKEADGALGTVAERNLDGENFDVPWLYVTADVLPRTSDSDDETRSWTAQHAGGEREDEDGNSLDPVALVEVVGTPGQTFRVRELPNRKVAEAAGIDYDQWVAGLPVRADVPGEAPRRGIPA